MTMHVSWDTYLYMYDDVYTFLDWASIIECGAPEKVLKLKR